MSPLCDSCRQQPAAFTVARRYPWGVDAMRHVCSSCAPDPTDCAEWFAFGSVAAVAVKVRAESEARRIAHLEAGRAAA